MAVALYFDQHVPAAITAQLTRRGVDVLTTQADGTTTLPDEDLLMRASQMGRLLYTRDIGFRVLAEDWQRQGRPFTGLLFSPQENVGIGQLVADLDMIAKASDLSDWANMVVWLPFK